MTSDEVLDLEQLPESAVVIGGGAIGCEFASMLADMGVRVTILEALPRILPGVDKDVADVVVRSFKRRGIDDPDRRDRARATRPARTAGLTTVRVRRRWRRGRCDPSSLEVAGRRGLGRAGGRSATGSSPPAAASRSTSAGFVKVDELMQTSEAGVWAVGDLVATPGLAHVGFAEAMLVIDQVLGRPAVPVDYGKVPWCVYTFPEVAFAGYSEEAAREAGFEVVTKKDPFAGNGRALIIGEPEGLVKVIAEKLPDGSAGRILGVHMVGPWVTEQLGQGYLAVNWEATAEEVAHFVQPHPSLSEVFGETVLALAGRGLHVG